LCLELLMAADYLNGELFLHRFLSLVFIVARCLTFKTSGETVQVLTTLFSLIERETHKSPEE
jgi:hypothetical protein